MNNQPNRRIEDALERLERRHPGRQFSIVDIARHTGIHRDTLFIIQGEALQKIKMGLEERCPELLSALRLSVAPTPCE